jgi:hypothetical protein
MASLTNSGVSLYGNVGRALDDVQALVAAAGAPEGILAEPQRSGRAAGASRKSSNPMQRLTQPLRLISRRTGL